MSAAPQNLGSSEAPAPSAVPVRLWEKYSTWESADTAWENNARQLSVNSPIKTQAARPDLPGIRPKTRKFLRFKALFYLLSHDEDRVFIRYYFTRPIRYGLAILRSYLRKQPVKRDGDFYLYGLQSVDELKPLLAKPGSILCIGFSYCHKPLECPSGRFTDQCQHDQKDPVCGQCFIGKCMHSMPAERSVPIIIPTVHHIGEKMFEQVAKHPKQEVTFIITACELTLEMFADWCNMIGTRGLGIRLDGVICNTMKAFEASEIGIKPGLTIVLNDTKKKIMELIAYRREVVSEQAQAIK